MTDSHTEFYQFSRGVKVVVSRGEEQVKQLTFEGEPIRDERLFRVGLQGYHYKNMQDFFGITEEEVSTNAPSKVISTNAIDILEESLCTMELVTCPDDERWITLP